MTADDIWRQIRSLARLKIRNAIAERRKKDRKAMDDLLVNADRNLPELTVFQPAVEYFVEAIAESCQETYSICSQAREQVGLERTSEFERAVFENAIQPQITSERGTAAFDIETLPATLWPGSPDLNLHRFIHD